MSEMNDKCFCHFNGYRVKDAEARQLIENKTSLKETNSGVPISFWVGTLAEYEALETQEQNCLYIISDDTSNQELIDLLNNMQNAIEETKAIAEGASTTAEEAKTIAGGATETANSASTTAEEAKSIAEEAKTIAEEAKNNPGNTPGEGSATAEEAKAIAEEALHVANYAHKSAQGCRPDDKMREFHESGGMTLVDNGNGVGLITNTLEAVLIATYKTLSLVYCMFTYKILGLIEKGEVIEFAYDNPYKVGRIGDVLSNLRYPLMNCGVKQTLPLMAQITNDRVYITATEDIEAEGTNGSEISVQFAGWYPYDPSLSSTGDDEYAPDDENTEEE